VKSIGGQRRHFEQGKELIELDRELRREKRERDDIELREELERTSQKIKEKGIDRWREE
jgi:hypothetical protein